MSQLILPAAAVIAGGGLAANALYWAFCRLRRKNFAAEEISAALQAMSVTATINSLLLAFMAISVWEAYKAADSSAMNEASAAALLGRGLAYYGGADAMKARAEVRNYAACVVREDWPLMAGGGSSQDCLDRLEGVFERVSKISPASVREQVLLAQAWERANEMSRSRRERLQAGRSSVPATLWLVTALGTALTLGLLFVLPPGIFARVIITVTASAFALVFYLIISLQHPFAGPDAIRPTGFERVIRNLDNWDKSRAAEPGRR